MKTRGFSHPSRFCVHVIFKCRHQQCPSQTHFYWQESGSGCCVYVSKYQGIQKLENVQKTKGYCLSPKNDSSVAAFNTKYWSREK